MTMEEMAIIRDLLLDARLSLLRIQREIDVLVRKIDKALS